MRAPAIGVLPYGMDIGPDLALCPLSRIRFPLGLPDALAGGSVADLGSDDHLVLFPRVASHLRMRRGTHAKISLMQGEPSVFFRKHMSMLHLSHRRFFRVLSFNEDLLARIPNGIFFPYGTTWIPDWRDLDIEKAGMCSLVASAKRDSTGHKLRHEIVQWAQNNNQDVKVLGRGYAPFEDKADGLAPYRYSVVIENVREPNYFSEKLLDTVFCGAVPIYWGCPNLDRFCDPTGIIQCNSAEEIRNAVSSMSQTDFSERGSDLMRLQQELGKFADLPLRAATAIRDSL
ncbi:hypothetical protein [Primorskyibacter sp. S87]|uniref:hypothetical protein n=1 Tax=Primorskyibacter sp. S87 TaxID=3415126 RepID=UPI003C7D18E8